MDSAAKFLRERGLRATAQRQAVLGAVTAEPHATVDEIIELVRDRLGGVSRQAVYDCLTALESVGLVRRFGAPGQAARFEPRAAHVHHHLICRSCGAVQDVPGEAPAPPSGDHGFAVADAEIVFWGHCAQCRSSSNQPRKDDHVG